MNGATALVKTLLGAGVRTCFANPGTSEMHFVAALDAHPNLRCVLCLFEGGATGAADAYARMTGEPGVTLLHLGPGLGNGWANLHNARKAGAPVLNIVGEHARAHLRWDAPLKGDLDGVARSASDWVRVCESPEEVAQDGAAAVRAALSRGGQVATLVLPADCAWGEASGPAEPGEVPAAPIPARDRIEAAAARLSRPGAALYAGGPALWGEGAEIAGAIAARTGCRFITPFFSPRVREGEGAVASEPLKYDHAGSAELLREVSELIVVGERHPVNFFAYPDRPSTPEPPDCLVTELCPLGWDALATLRVLADAVGVTGDEEIARRGLSLPRAPSGPLEPEGLADALVRTLPEGAIYVNEGITAGFAIPARAQVARAHERLDLMGGAIGQGLPSAVGAAVACPDRPVLAVVGDGSAMYTIQSLWTMAREQLDVTVVILANRGYRILHGEMAALGVENPGRNARRMFDVEDPALDFCALAAGHGLPAERVETAEALETALARAYAAPGPHLIEAVLP
ncbi:acetolactate synthase large subunit [Histidinibacterium aquaticum]|uniref:Acetolactate synthase large subunit n=1 Tax=Histidinibacterium aquaticum TaxID=2613962 RepID=A0A5J5GNW5_9RHOB|nr:acetolactate synthase large subunit [Histidinibacterium aquaticum]KAA9009132.1 acetolactate synthase large subunit [Histidinibacterium aquaticum]